MLTIEHLSRTEKLKLMESLWDSLCAASPDEPASPGWHSRVLAARMQRLDAGEESVSSWGEAKERIRNQTKAG